MSGLFSTLHSSVKALSAHGRSIEIVGKNLANVNNPAYARQRVRYGDRGTVMTPQGAVSLGLEALGVQQLRDALLDRQLMSEVGRKAAVLAEQSGGQRAQAALGQNVDRLAAGGGAAATGSQGLAAALDDFFNAFQSFAASPTDAGEREMLLQKTDILADRFHLADQRLAQVQADLGAEIATDVEEINRLLSTVSELNRQIGRFEINAPGSAVDLRDQRQARLEELAALLPVEVRDTTSGQFELLVRDAEGDEVRLVAPGEPPGSVRFEANRLTAGSPRVVIDLESGSISGALAVRDGAIQTLRDDLDVLARQLVLSVNEAYQGDFFRADGTTARTIARGSVTASMLRAGDSTDAGDNSRAMEVAELGNTPIAGLGGTFTGALSRAVGRLGQALAGANARVEDQTAIERLVRAQRDAVSGTSMDEEIADLMKYQRAFEASSRVFNTMDELLDLVVNRLGRA